MTRKAIKLKDTRALFGRSGNQCAFPGCTHEIISDKNKFIAQVCHIEAAEEGGERYNENSNDEYRRSCENLIILCYAHHIETNDVDEYPTPVLKKMKDEHESLFIKNQFKIDETVLYDISKSMEEYWDEIKRLNTIEHNNEGAEIMEIDGDLEFVELFENFKDNLDSVENLLNILQKSDEALYADFEDFLYSQKIKDVEYYENPFKMRNIELHNLTAPNIILKLKISFYNVYIRYLQEYLKTNNNDLKAKTKFKEIKEILKEYAQNATYSD